MRGIFLSHSMHDDDIRFLKPLVTFLKEQQLEPIFFSSQPDHGVPAGEEWKPRLYAELQLAQAVIFLCTEHALESHWCFAELVIARSLGKPIFAIQRGTKRQHELVREVQSADLDQSGYEQVCEDLAAWLKSHVDFVESWELGQCPYPGLDAFTSDHVAVFFGRREDIEYIDQLFQLPVRVSSGRRLVAVIGPSGSGKSSLIQAGVCPRLKKRGWGTLPAMVPDAAPTQRLVLVLREVLKGPNISSACERVRHALVMFDPTLQTQLGNPSPGGRKGQSGETPILLVVDQFEELLTLTGPEERRRFLALLDMLVSSPLVGAAQPSLPVWLLVTVRSEFVSQRATGNELTEFLGKGYASHQLLPIPSAALRDVIRQPAEMAGVRYETELLDHILDDVVRGDLAGSSLPLLAFALRQTWLQMEQRTRGQQALTARVLTLSDYQQTGGVVGAIASRAKVAREELRRRSKADLVFPTLDRFVLLTDDGKPVRRRVPVSELTADATDVARTFEKERLMRVDDTGEGPAYEVTHEAIFDAWNDLQDHLAANRERLVLRTELLRRAAYWDQQGRKTDYLVQGELLQRSREFPSLSDEPLLHAFLEASFAAAQEDEREATRRQVIVSAQEEAEKIGEQVSKHPVDCLIRAMRASVACVERTGEAPPLSLQGALYEAVCVARERWRTDVHTSSVRAVVCSPDGQLVASGSDDRSIRLWDVLGQSISTLLDGHDAGVTALAFSPDGAVLASAAYDGTVRLWPMQQGASLQVLSIVPEVVTALSFNPLGDLLAGVSETGRLFLWRIAGDRSKVSVGVHTVQAHNAFATACAFSPAGDWLVIGAGDGSISLWNCDGSYLKTCADAHDGATTAVAFSPDGQCIATGGLDKTVRLWTTELIPIGRPFEGHTRYITALTFSPSGRIILSAAGDGTVRQWQRNGTMFESALTGHDGPVCSVAVSPDTRIVVSGGCDRTVRVWDYTGRQLHDPVAAFEEPINTVLFPAEDIILVSYDHTIRRCAVPGGAVGRAWEGHEGFIWAMATSPNRNCIVSASGDKTLRLWNLNGQQMGVPLRGHEADVTNVVFTSEGDIVSCSSDGSIRLWESAGTGMRILGRHDGQVNVVDTQGAGSDLVILSGGNDCRLCLWDKWGRQIFSIPMPDGPVKYATFAPDGQSIISVGEKLLRHWSHSGKEIDEPMSVHEGSISMVLANRTLGKYITCGSDGTLRVWAANNHPLGEPLRGHGGGVWAIDVSPSGSALVSGGEDGTIHIWRTGTWRTWLQAAVTRLAHHPRTMEDGGLYRIFSYVANLGRV